MLVLTVVGVALVYLLSTTASIPETGFASITKHGAYVTLCVFAAGYTSFLVLEALSENDVILYDDTLG